VSRKKYQPEQGVNLLRPVEVAVANGKKTAQEANRWSRRSFAHEVLLLAHQLG
jgi:hypothetical protein